jgi:hypothetical protein
MKSMTFIPAGNISRKARLDRDMIPSFACLYRARGMGALSDTVTKSWISYSQIDAEAAERGH